MATQFKFPDVGEGIHEGEVKKWHVKEGDRVEEHKTIVEVETDKAVVAIPSPKTGVVLKIHVPEGKVVKVGEALATIGDPGEAPVPAPVVAAARPPAAPAAAPHVAQKGVAVVGELEEAPPEEEEAPAPPAPPAPAPVPAVSPAGAEVLATPAVRRLARELNVDLTRVKGTGPSGRVTEEDVRKSASGSVPAMAPAPSPAPAAASIPEAVPPAPAPATPEAPAPAGEAPKVVRKYDLWGYISRVPFKGVRRAIAKNMARSLYTATHVTHMDEADVTHLWEIREREAKLAEEKGVKLTFLPFIVKALVAALRQHPLLNSSLDEANEEVIVKKYYNIGIAVATDDGLLVPVVKGADQKTILELGREIAELAEKARARSLDLGDMRGGSFTITNYGSIGGIHATPIINYPEVGILGLGRITEQPRLVNGRVVARRILPLSVAFDHRVLDGAECARFVNDLKRFLEDPDSLLVA
jgi:pyruvate dehydrogenase E2 component (dihydrolipoamide acetyltransferase)